MFSFSHGRHAYTDLFRAESLQSSTPKPIADGIAKVLTAQGITNRRFQPEESNSRSCDIKMVSTLASCKSVNSTHIFC